MSNNINGGGLEESKLLKACLKKEKMLLFSALILKITTIQ